MTRQAQSDSSQWNIGRTARCLIAGHVLLLCPVLTMASGQALLDADRPAENLLSAETSILTPDNMPSNADADNLDPAGTDRQEDALYSNGTHAIQETRWADAEGIFVKVIERHGAHAEGALYWKAYAESRLGKRDEALGTCAQLRKEFPASRWIDDCGALEIEIHGESGHPVAPQSVNSDDLKLLALNAQMRQDEAHALPQIQQILASDAAESYKEHALFLLAQSQSKAAQQMLAQVANPTADAPAAIRSNAALQGRARQFINATNAASATNTTSAAQADPKRIGLDVIVSDAAGRAVPGLTAADFTVLDNGRPQKLGAFHAVNGSEGPNAPPGSKEAYASEVIILLDTVNAPVAEVAYERDQVKIYLRSNGGKLSNLTSVLILNGDGYQRITPPTQDGNALAAALDKANGNLRPIRRSEGFYGDGEKLQLSLNAIADLSHEELQRPGRKILLWIGPGWPYLVATESWPSDQLVQAVFEDIVAFSNNLRTARIVLYSLDADRSQEDSFHWFRYKEYQKPVTKAKNANVGNLALQLLAEQSGGQAWLSTDKYLSEQLAEFSSDLGHWYYLSYPLPPASHKDEYHSLSIKVDKPGLTVRTRTGYYDQP